MGLSWGLMFVVVIVVPRHILDAIFNDVGCKHTIVCVSSSLSCPSSPPAKFPLEPL